MEQKLPLHTKIQRHIDLLVFLGIFLFLASKSCLVADSADFLLIAASLFASYYVLNHLLFNTRFWEVSTSEAVLETSTVENAVGCTNTWAGLNWANRGTGKNFCCNIQGNLSENRVKKEPIYLNTNQTVKAAYDHYLQTRRRFGKSVWSSHGLNPAPVPPALTSLALPGVPGQPRSAKSFCSYGSCSAAGLNMVPTFSQ